MEKAMVDVQALIEKARAGVAEAGRSVEIELGGEAVEVRFRQVPGHVWADLVATHPPRPGTDGRIGFNTDAVVKDYPAEYVTVAGEPVTPETWAALFDVVTSPNIKFMAAGLWTLNQSEPTARIAELGKARAGASKKKRNSPAS